VSSIECLSSHRTQSVLGITHFPSEEHTWICAALVTNRARVCDVCLWNERAVLLKQRCVLLGVSVRVHAIYVRCQTRTGSSTHSAHDEGVLCTPLRSRHPPLAARSCPPPGVP